MKNSSSPRSTGLEIPNINPLTYFQKPAIGHDNNNEDLTPVEIIFPTGGVALGIAMKNPDAENALNASNNLGVLASAPAYSEFDIVEKRSLKLAFLVAGIVNLILTILLYAYADSADSSKVESGTGFLPFTLEQVSSERRPIEQVSFAFTIILLVLGMISALYEFSLGLSAYCLGIMLNFFLGTSALPFLVYSFRYILDIGMLYFGLVLRSRLLYTFLPLHLHRT
jgi:hypothetical protein